MSSGFRAQPTGVADRRATLLDWSEVLRRCRAAAATALKGDDWSWSDVEDCSAALVALLLERTTLEADRVPIMPRPVRAAVHRVLDPTGLQTGIPAYRPSSYPERIPLRSCAMSFLTQRAAHWRESVIADRKRTEEDALRMPVFTVDTDALETLERLEAETAELESLEAVTPYSAADTARDFLTRTGSAPAARETAAWIAVYTAALSGGEHGAAQDAAETLGMTAAAHRKQVSRGIAAMLERGSVNDYRAALGYRTASAHRDGDSPRGAVPIGRAEIPNGLQSRRSTDRTRRLAPDQPRANAAGKGGVLRRSSGRLDANGDAQRATLLYRAPLSCAGMRESKTRKRNVWSGAKRADWTRRYSRAMTVARWANAARYSRQTTYGRTLAERVARRTEAGIMAPPMELELPRYSRELPTLQPVTLPVTLSAIPGEAGSGYVPGGAGRKLSALDAPHGEAGTLSAWHPAEDAQPWQPVSVKPHEARYLTDRMGWLRFKLTRSGTLRRATRRDRA